MNSNPLVKTLYYQIFEKNHDALMIIQGTEFIEWNKKAEILFGLDPSPQGTYKVSDISPLRQPCHEFSTIKARKHFNETLKKGGHLFEWEHLNIKTSQHFMCEVHLIPLIHNHQPIVIATVRDIQDRILTEKKIYDAQTRCKLLLEYASDMIQIMQPDGKPQYVGGQIEEILGYTVEEYMEKARFELVHPHDLPNILSVLKEGLKEQGAKRSVTYRCKHKLGHYVYLEATGCNLTQHPSIAGIFMTIRNIDERKKYESMLIETKVNAEKANHAKTTFIANMSHEIRTPLNGIIGSTDLLFYTQLSHQQKKFLNYIKKSSEHLKNVINDILDFSKIEADMLKLEWVWSNLHQILDEVISLLSLSAEEKKIDLILEKERQLPQFILVDPLRLKQIIINLIGNAIKFTDEGYVKLCVSHENNNELNHIIHFKVLDTGIGITSDEQKKLFKAFSQADCSATRKFGGTGLGLVISQLLAKKMGSSIHMKSEYGIGSCFSFSINTPLTSANHNTFIDNYNFIHFQEIMCQKKISILIAEDIEINRMILLEMVKKIFPQGDFHQANDGKDAIDIYQKHRPDIVFMDIQMPIQDGINATANIRHYEKENELASALIIGVSASILQEDMEKSRQAGMNDYIVKPYHKEDILQILIKFMPNLFDIDTDNHLQ